MTRPGAGTRTGLEERAEAIRARMALRAWEYRQRNGAKGTWTRLRRLLAGAAEVFAIDDEARAELLSEGFRREGVGDELEPPRTYLVVPRTRAMRIAARRPLEIRLSAELLAAPTLVLVPFERP